MALPVRRIPSNSGSSPQNQPVPVVEPEPAVTAAPAYEAPMPDLDGGLPELDGMPSLDEAELPTLDTEPDEYLQALEADDDEFDAILASTPPVSDSPALPEAPEEDEELGLPDFSYDDEEEPAPAVTPVFEAPAEVRPPSPDDHVIEVDDDDFESFIDKAFDEPEAFSDDDGEFDAPLELPDDELDDEDEEDDFVIIDEADDKEATDDWAADFDKILEEDTKPAAEDEIPEDDEEQEELEDDEEYLGLEEEEVPEEEALKPLSKKGASKPADKKKSKGKNKAPLTKLSEGMFRALTLIPFVGRLFKPFERFGKFFLPLIAVILLLAIPFGVYSFAGNAIANPPILTFPDGGSATIGNFKFDEATKTASGTITNTGDVVADVTPVFSVWTYEFGLDPRKWLAFQELGKCEGAPVSVDIDATADVSAQCSFETVEGITPKASGSLVY